VAGSCDHGNEQMGSLYRAFIGLSRSPEAEPALGRLDRCDEIGPRAHVGLARYSFLKKHAM